LKVLLADAMNLVRRVYEASVRHPEPSSVEQIAQSCLSSLQRGIREVGASHFLCCFEGGGNTWRHKLYDQYKANREPYPDSLHQTITRTQQLLVDNGLQHFQVEELEADDLIASVATQLAQHNIPTVILSTDKDFHQLISPTLVLRHHFDQCYRDLSWVQTYYGLAPKQTLDVQALMGDAADNIPGVPGVGLHNAKKLIQRFGDLSKLIEFAPYIEGKVGINIRKHKDAVRLSYQLIQLKTDLEFGWNLKQIALPRMQ